MAEFIYIKDKDGLTPHETINKKHMLGVVNLDCVESIVFQFDEKPKARRAKAGSEWQDIKSAILTLQGGDEVEVTEATAQRLYFKVQQNLLKSY